MDMRIPPLESKTMLQTWVEPSEVQRLRGEIGRASSPQARESGDSRGSARADSLNSFQTTLTPNPEKQILLCSETRRNMFLNVLLKCFQVPVPVVW